jgi:hypothetical protein
MITFLVKEKIMATAKERELARIKREEQMVADIEAIKETMSMLIEATKLLIIQVKELKNEG